ncbi:oligogalacturonate-specific porin KdgM family protein [Vagococcus sp. WN89Y]|uniref:oligogalacturonate-specific porin KdgM family protein n=1 Tax=Vagococcus sp. WN89Y TaxID=3457258 RepID=UPI003FCCE2B2
MLRTFLLATIPFISLATQAVTFDYRHEMNDSGGNNHKDRLLMSHRFANGFGLSLEGKWKGSQNKDQAYHETVSNGTEVVASYVYKINPTYQLEPGFSLDTSSSSNNYRPYLRGKVNFTNDVSGTLRYRPYFKRNSGNIGSAKDSHENGYNLTAALSFKLPLDFQFDYELDYKKATSAGVLIADNENYDWTHDFKFTYKFDKNWSPYFAIGNVSGSKYTDERQTRFRVGVKYNF